MWKQVVQRTPQPLDQDPSLVRFLGSSLPDPRNQSAGAYAPANIVDPRIAELERQLAQAKAEANDAKTKLFQANEAFDLLQAQLNKERDDHLDTKRKLETSEETAKSQLELFKSHYHPDTESWELADLLAKMAQEVERHQKAFASIRYKVSRGEIPATILENAILRDEIARKQLENDELRTACVGLSTRLDQLIAQEAPGLLRIRRNLDKADAESAGLRTQLEQARKEITELHAQLQLKQARDENTQLRNAPIVPNTELETELQQARDELQHVRDEITQLRNAPVVVPNIELEAIVAELRAQLQQARHEIAQLRALLEHNGNVLDSYELDRDEVDRLWALLHNVLCKLSPMARNELIDNNLPDIEQIKRDIETLRANQRQLDEQEEEGKLRDAMQTPLPDDEVDATKLTASAPVSAPAVTLGFIVKRMKEIMDHENYARLVAEIRSGKVSFQQNSVAMTIFPSLRDANAQKKAQIALFKAIKSGNLHAYVEGLVPSGLHLTLVSLTGHTGCALSRLLDRVGKLAKSAPKPASAPVSVPTPSGPQTSVKVLVNGDLEASRNPRPPNAPTGTPRPRKA